MKEFGSASWCALTLVAAGPGDVEWTPRRPASQPGALY
jgi:hypothetical protein